MKQCALVIFVIVQVEVYAGFQSDTFPKWQVSKTVESSARYLNSVNTDSNSKSTTYSITVGTGLMDMFERINDDHDHHAQAFLPNLKHTFGLEIYKRIGWRYTYSFYNLWIPSAVNVSSSFGSGSASGTDPVHILTAQVGKKAQSIQEIGLAYFAWIGASAVTMPSVLYSNNKGISGWGRNGLSDETGMIYQDTTVTFMRNLVTPLVSATVGFEVQFLKPISVAYAMSFHQGFFNIYKTVGTYSTRDLTDIPFEISSLGSHVASQIVFKVPVDRASWSSR